MIGDLLGVVFGGGRNALRETIEVFRPNAEASAMRDAAKSAAALSQFAAEFQIERKGWFDRFVDGLNRLPRPMLAFGTLGLFVSAMTNPVWFAQRMQGIALVPEPLWWLMGAIVSFYFGARHQAKAHDLHRSLAATVAHAPEVVRQIEALEGFRIGEETRVRPEDTARSATAAEATLTLPVHQSYQDNAALEDWRLSRDR